MSDANSKPVPLFSMHWIYYPLIACLAYLATWRGWIRQSGQIYSIETLLPAAEETDIDCTTDFNTKYRTLSGICNDFDYPRMGAAGTRFNRHTGLIAEELSYPESIDNGLLTPNPRDVARDLLHETDERPRVAATSLNLLVVSWIQFMVHDWVFHGDNSKDEDESIKIPLSKDDPLYNPYGPQQQYMSIEATKKDETYGYQTDDDNRPQTFINHNTAWWDANQMYGIDESINEMVRDPDDPAKIKLDYNDDYGEYRLPTDEQGEITGFRENWWLGLSLLHNLFAMEHNHVINELRTYYGPDTYSDDELYHIGRLIVSALLAKIHTVEWTPAILDNDVGDIGLRTNWYGFEYGWFQSVFDGVYIDPSEYKLVDQIKQVVASDPVKGGKKNLYGANYQFTEAFVSVYRLHPLLPDEIKLNCILDKKCKTPSKKKRFILDETLNEQTVDINNNFYQNDLFYTFGTNHPNALFLNGYSSFITDFQIPTSDDRIDLATIDLLRQRERGVPRYNNFRDAMGMPPITDYTQLTDDVDLIERVSKHYPDINDMDLLIGMFLENEGGKRVPNGWIFGETQFAVFLESASRRLKADRFFTDCYTAEYYTDFGINYIELNTFKDILIRHFPNLKDYVPSNPFFAWYQEEKNKKNKKQTSAAQNGNDDKYIRDIPEEINETVISEKWLYFMLTSLALLIIGNIFCIGLNCKRSWDVNNRKKIYHKVNVIASSDDDLSVVQEVNIN